MTNLGQKIKKYENFYPKFCICIPRLQNGVWLCISHKGTGICNIYTGRINQFHYIKTLENNLYHLLNPCLSLGLFNKMAIRHIRLTHLYRTLPHSEKN
ncbi:hypothetical protein BpHYR1_007399 [Brachionus plicatilis]|uniref:Uncharacterized protein n=1 Tax=Brachionus plicatilis TaxID=10195 RepID=A0A3M7T0V8_BRAPC|nr:hypothetical protein BpHYR1_007399 [Brachionus plicatilis]